MSDPNTINYQPLEAMDSVWSQAFKSSFQGWDLAIVLLAAAIIIIFLLLGIGMVVIYLPIIYLAFLSYRVGKYKNSIWQAFATANGWPLDSATSQAMLIPPSMQFGHSPSFSPVIQAELGPVACDLFTYKCVTGYGKQQQTHTFTVGRLAIAKALPHLLLLSKKAGSDLHRDMQASQSLQLEGNFGDYFKLQIEKGQEVDALTILTPDVMRTLIDYDQAEDIEILGNVLYFITNKDKRSYKDVKGLIRSIVELSAQIVQNISLETVPGQVSNTVTPPATPGPTQP